MAMEVKAEAFDAQSAPEALEAFGPVAPFKLFEEIVKGEEEPAPVGPAIGMPSAVDLHEAVVQQEQELALQLSQPPVKGIPKTVWAAPPSHALGGPLAYRAMRDALAVQLARRGFDGLRQSALWLVTELTADFLKSIGAQLQREGPPPASSAASATASGLSIAIVRRIQRQTNMHGLSEWRQAALNFTRVVEPPGVGAATGRGPAEARLNVIAPPQVAPLYTAMKGVWNYKQTGSGRAAHSQAGQSDVTSGQNAPLHPGVTGRELSEAIRLNKKQKGMAEAWLQAAAGTSHTAPVLLPGALLAPAGGTGADAGTGGGGKGGKQAARGRKGKQAP